MLVMDYAPICEVLKSSADTVYSTRIDKARWQLAPYLYDLDIVYKHGWDHLNMDPLSRVERSVDVEG